MKLIEHLERLHREATPTPWTLATAVERGEHGSTPIGIVGGCERRGNPHDADDLIHNCAASRVRALADRPEAGEPTEKGTPE